jgi:hypothetical protein
LIFANDIFLYGDVLITEKQRTLVSHYRETGHEVNAEKYVFIFMSGEENVEEFRNKKASNTFCGLILTNQNCIHK